MMGALSRTRVPDRIRSIVRQGRRAARLTHAWLPYRFARDGGAFAPLHVTLELTYLCNLRCRMCSLVQGGMVTRSGQRRSSCLGGHAADELRLDDYVDVLDQLSRLGTRSITITGGEPTLREDLPEVVRAAKRHGFHTYLISNGTAPSPVYREVVRAGIDAVSISVDGEQRLHDAIRGGEGSFRRACGALATIGAMRADHGVGLDVNCTVSSMNAGMLEPVLDLAVGVGADALVLGLLHFATGQNLAATEAMLPGAPVHLKEPRVAAVLRDVDPGWLLAELRRLERLGRERGLAVRLTPRLDEEGMRRHFSGALPAPEAFCIHPWMASRIDPWGQLYPCWLDVRMGDVRREPVAALWNGGAYREFRKTIRAHGTLPKCATCPALAEPVWRSFPWLRRVPDGERATAAHG